jgi:excinuclease ABC subunit C
MNVALEVMDNLGLSIPIAGLYKNDKHQTNGLMYNEEMYPLDHKSKLFLMLVRMQDEVHRFAITTHRNKRSKGLTNSFLDDIKGLGKKRLEVLLKTYPTLDDLKKVSIEELQTIVPLNIAQEIKNKVEKM